MSKTSKKNNSKNMTQHYDKNLYNLLQDRINYIQDIIRNTNLSIQGYVHFELFSNTEANTCMAALNVLYENTEYIKRTFFSSHNHENPEVFIDKLQYIINNLSPILAKYGTKNMDDIIYICFGSEFTNFDIKKRKADLPIEINSKFDLIRKYIHPIGFKIYNKDKKMNIQYPNTQSLNINKITEDNIVIDNAPQFECFDVDIASKSFNEKVYGIKTVIHSSSNKTLIIYGFVDDINLDFIDNKYIEKRKKELMSFSPEIPSFNQEILQRQIEIITLKDILIYSNFDIYKKNSSILVLVNNIKIAKLETTIKNFMDMDLYSKRNTLIDLLIFDNDNEIQYLSYLLYDLMTCKNQNNIDSVEQTCIFNSFPWKIKNYFKDAMKNTINFTQNSIQKYDTNRISIEQQIYLWKVSDSIKEKAITKLKEIKGKSEDSGTKAKQYLEGLLKIPFNIYREEPVLKMTKKTNSKFIKLLHDSLQNELIDILPGDNMTDPEIKYTNSEIANNLYKIETNLKKAICDNINIINCKPKEINDMYNIVVGITGQPKNKKNNKKTVVHDFLTTGSLNDIIGTLKRVNGSIIEQNRWNTFKEIFQTIENIKKDILNMKTMMETISHYLDESIHGHKYAKKQIMKIICQWINGEQTGYCFGFEGSPGIGKTSLAKKGLANCLTDEKGEPRPFSFIALGGSCNGSTFEGHSYTYVNSTWGKIVDILMESKCMNPIIYIDELDKVSKSEHGKEIIGILTHLIDPTQNDIFQDKYFNGIQIDLSKALFIFSYNDAEQIDRILLDRIHRIKFDNLTTSEKIVITNRFILPEFNKKMGFHKSIIKIDKDTIEFIINEYTAEPGIRKLKEILFDLYGEINIELLNSNEIQLPVTINRENLENKYLKKYNKNKERKIHTTHKVGIVNGLWANSLGKGGIIPIEAVFFPSSSFLEMKLTGLQGDIMKESMNVAKTLAWHLTPDDVKKKLISNFKTTLMQGIHVHCPEGSVSKDGPSAGVAITIAIYSLFNNLPVNNTIGITGEIDLQGNVLPIGGLDCKILGGIHDGIKKFIFPEENSTEYEHFLQKYTEENDQSKTLENIAFTKVSHISELINIVFI
jgi:ATP-dependent Lon protease